MGPFGLWGLLIPIVAILAMAGVQILRPLSKRLGDVLELLAEDRYDRSSVGFEEVLRRLDSIEGRIAQIEGSKAIGKGEDPDADPNLGLATQTKPPEQGSYSPTTARDKGI